MSETVLGGLLAVSAIARRLGYTPATIRHWILAGKLTALRSPTGRYRVPRSELDRLLKALNPQAPPKN